MSASAALGRRSPKKSFDHAAFAMSCPPQSASAALRLLPPGLRHTRHPESAINT
jgi:hypothetical protein